MSLKENKVLKELQCRNDIIIKIAGKGSALVIIDVNDYVTRSRSKQNDNRIKRKTENKRIMIL